MRGVVRPVPNVRIDDDVYEFLQRQAVAFVDTPNSVLRRLLHLDPESDGAVSESGSGRHPVPDATFRRGRQRSKMTRRSSRGQTQKGRTRTPAGALLPEEEYILPLLSALGDRGDSGPAREIIAAVGQRLDGKLTATDRERLASGAIRWENRVQFVRLRLVEEGLLARESPRGVWALTDAGRARLVEGGKPT